jgi:DNA-binding LacI/PurR family transcriptional regulator
VSVSTVSRTFNRPETVRPQIRQRVEAAARSLDYSPNRMAQSLITGRTRSIGLIVPDVANPFFPELIKAAQARARTAEYSAVLADTDEDGYVEARVARQMARQVDGLIICSSRMDDAAAARTRELVTTVFVQRPVPDTASVVMDTSTGMRQAVAHLHALGHVRLAYLGGPPNSWSDGQRRVSAHAATADLGLELVELGPFQPQFSGGVQAADVLIAQGVTGVLAYNDLVALGVISRLSQRGFTVPTQVSVIGFDDIAMAEMSLPPLTTVAMPVAIAGRMAVELLLDLLEDRRQPGTERIELPTHLVVRGSTAPAPEVVQQRNATNPGPTDEAR